MNEVPFPLLQAMLRHEGEIEVTVRGSSMEPTLRAGDTVTVAAKEHYAAGDILVFDYAQEGLLIHRLLKIENGCCFCKGDNSYRLESLMPVHILGAVTEASRGPLPPFHDLLIALALAVSRSFTRCRFDAAAVKRTALYRVYASLLWGPECLVGLPDGLRLIDIEEEVVCTFDAQNGKTRYFDGDAAVLLRVLSRPTAPSALSAFPQALATLLEEGILEPKGDLA